MKVLDTRFQMQLNVASNRLGIEVAVKLIVARCLLEEIG